MEKSKRMASNKAKITIPKPKDELTHFHRSMTKLIYLGSAFCILVALMIIFFIYNEQVVNVMNKERAELEYLRENSKDQIAQIEKLHFPDAELRRIVNN